MITEPKTKNFYYKKKKLITEIDQEVKTLCNVAQKAPDNIAWEKILSNVVLILFGQHCTAENPMQCCPRGSR